MNNLLRSTTKIRFQDCDPFNHLNNSKYIDYLINAREDQILEEYNLDMYSHIKKNQAGWVVSSHQIAFLKPAFLMEEVSIESQLFSYDQNSLEVEMKMLDKSGQKIKSLLWTQFFYFDLKSQQKTEHPTDLMELFASVLNPIDQNSFKERTGHLILQAKKNI
tara:strand:- start:510 stop:995 length:486 start_codon:yes stop_codon:yes gene_type:complete